MNTITPPVTVGSDTPRTFRYLCEVLALMKSGKPEDALPEEMEAAPDVAPVLASTPQSVEFAAVESALVAMMEAERAGRMEKWKEASRTFYLALLAWLRSLPQNKATEGKQA